MSLEQFITVSTERNPRIKYGSSYTVLTAEDLVVSYAYKLPRLHLWMENLAIKMGFHDAKSQPRGTIIIDTSNIAQLLKDIDDNKLNKKSQCANSGQHEENEEIFNFIDNAIRCAQLIYLEAFKDKAEEHLDRICLKYTWDA